MAGGLAALLDDIAAMSRLAAASVDDVAAGAAKASTKAAGVVVDDAAVTPQYLDGAEPARELPMVRRIAVGSLRNKAIIIPIALLLSQFAPWLLTPLLPAGIADGLLSCTALVLMLTAYFGDRPITTGADASRQLVTEVASR